MENFQLQSNELRFSNGEMARNPSLGVLHPLGAKPDRQSNVAALLGARRPKRATLPED
jgi:hypothetical protein